MRRVVVVGRSLATAQLIKELEKDFSGLPHLEITVIGPKEYFFPHLRTVFGRIPTASAAAIGPHLNHDHSQPRSINARLKIVTTEKDSYEYDYLIIDQQPNYTLEQIREIRAQATTLLAAGDEKTASSIEVQGDSLASVALALALKRDCLTHRRPRIAVCHATTGIDAIDSFLKIDGGLVDHRSKDRPCLIIASPSSAVSILKIKGLKLTETRSIQHLATLQALTYHNIFVIPPELLKNENTLVAARILAKDLGRNLHRLIDNQPLRTIPIGSPAIILQGAAATMFHLDKHTSRRFRARLAARVEARAWRQLSRAGSFSGDEKD